MEYPNLERDGWALDSAERRSEVSPDTFHIPPLAERRNLPPGKGVKLLFLLADEEASTGQRAVHCERMWVTIVERRPDGRYVGVLGNRPASSDALSAGDRVVFGPEHVAAVFDGDTGYEPHLPLPRG